jgi:hypothetical protein
MSAPDFDQIAEVILYSEGFKHAKEFGRKLVSLYNLAKELLSPQQHYDWGLRAMKTILKACGTLLQVSFRAFVMLLKIIMLSIFALHGMITILTLNWLPDASKTTV